MDAKMFVGMDIRMKQRAVIEFMSAKGCKNRQIFTGDESWMHQYEPETKRQSMEYKHMGSPSPKKGQAVSAGWKSDADRFLGLL